MIRNKRSIIKIITINNNNKNNNNNKCKILNGKSSNSNFNN